MKAQGNLFVHSLCDSFLVKVRNHRGEAQIQDLHTIGVDLGCIIPSFETLKELSIASGGDGKTIAILPFAAGLVGVGEGSCIMSGLPPDAEGYVNQIVAEAMERMEVVSR